MLRMQKNINDILKSVEHMEKVNGTRKQIKVTYVPSEITFKRYRADYFKGYELFPDFEWEQDYVPF